MMLTVDSAASDYAALQHACSPGQCRSPGAEYSKRVMLVSGWLGAVSCPSGESSLQLKLLQWSRPLSLHGAADSSIDPRRTPGAYNS